MTKRVRSLLVWAMAALASVLLAGAAGWPKH